MATVDHRAVECEVHVEGERQALVAEHAASLLRVGRGGARDRRLHPGDGERPPAGARQRQDRGGQLRPGRAQRQRAKRAHQIQGDHMRRVPLAQEHEGGAHQGRHPAHTQAALSARHPALGHAGTVAARRALLADIRRLADHVRLVPRVRHALLRRQGVALRLGLQRLLEHERAARAARGAPAHTPREEGRHPAAAGQDARDVRAQSGADRAQLEDAVAGVREAHSHDHVGQGERQRAARRYAPVLSRDERGQGQGRVRVRQRPARERQEVPRLRSPSVHARRARERVLQEEQLRVHTHRRQHLVREAQATRRQVPEHGRVPSRPALHHGRLHGHHSH